MATRTPKRPGTVPADARWVAADSEWEQGSIDVQGRKQGVFTYWRPDGTKCNECAFVDDVVHGPFKRFHENGEVSQDGSFVKGQLHGTRRWFACDEDTTEQMHEQGVSADVRRSEMDYVHGRVTGVRHFDGSGARVSPNGERYPERPASVDAAAEYVPDASEWMLGAGDAESGERVGRWRRWSAEGALLEDAQYEGGEKHGAVREYVTDPNPFADERVACEAGVAQHGMRVGTWELLDESGEVLSQVEYGHVSAAIGLRTLDAFSNEARRDWGTLGRQLLTKGEVRAGLLTLARACAVERSTAPLRSALAHHARALKPDAAEAFADQADSEFEALATALIDGCEVSGVLRKVAVLLDQASQCRAALDFINAAIVFAPAQRASLFTRSLVLISLGLKSEAEKDANDLAPSSADQARFLRTYVNLLFPAYAFWPAREAPQTSYDGLPEAPVKSLDEIKGLVQKLATRLVLVRAQLLTMVNESTPWLVPDVSALLPKGPSALKRGTLERTDDEGETSEIDFDETLELEGLDLPSLSRLARADWNSLTWLLWAAGETSVRMPTALKPPKDFPLAAGMAAQRLWRSRDQRVYGGRNAKAHGVAGFSFEGQDIAELHPNLASIAEQQYAEMQALFYWLSQSAVKSMWQSDLRGS